jgi:toxin FitB
VNYILDTNVISELVAAQPNPKVTGWLEEITPEQVFLSVLTIGELKKGIDKLPNSSRKAALDQWLREDLLVRFENHILPIDTDTVLLWGTMNAQLETAGRPIAAIDALLTATAQQHGYTFVTRNAGHFKKTGILVLNPWE